MQPHTFSFPPHATAPVAERLNRRIAGSGTRAQLRPYCFVLDTFVRGTPAEGPRTIRLLPALLPTKHPRQWSGDVLVVGECSGTADLAFITRLIEGLGRRRVLYLATSPREAAHLRTRFPAMSILEIPAGPLAFRLDRDACDHFNRDLAALTPILYEAGAWLARDAARPMRQVARSKAVWQRIRSQIACNAVVVRTNYHPLSAVVLADQVSTDRLTVAFQHSLVTCPASFVPIPSKRFVAFGRTSADLLETLDNRFSVETGQPRVCLDILAAGSLVDPIVPRTPRIDRGRILVIDSGEGFAPQFFGAGDQYAALERAVLALARELPNVVVRTHPRGGAGRWRLLAAGTSLEISSGRPLADDLARASVVIGLFSTVLPVSAASGIPTFFLWKPGWFFTPDLEPFVASHFVAPEDLAHRVDALLRDPDLFADACHSARLAGSQYFEGARTCDLDEAFVESMFAPL